MTGSTTRLRIAEIFARGRAEGRGILMPFVTAGHPSLAVTEAVIPALEEAGAGIVELGMPFSDPIADGPVIAASMHEALEAGVTPASVLDLVRRVRSRTQVGILIMTSHSIVDRIGAERFVAEAAAAGVDGLIMPDIDLEAARDVRRAADESGLSFTLLIAPTTPPDRLAAITRLCSGFVYLLARLGLTGERAEVPDVGPRVAAVRAATDLPIAVGFGISSDAHVRAVTRVADAAIVGSALVRRMGEAADPVAAARAFVRELAAGLGPEPGPEAGSEPD